MKIMRCTFADPYPRYELAERDMYWLSSSFVRLQQRCESGTRIDGIGCEPNPSRIYTRELLVSDGIPKLVKRSSHSLGESPLSV
jgi:hypothetical protein